MKLMLRWDILVTFFVCFDIDVLECLCLANAIFFGRYPVDYRDYNIIIYNIFAFNIYV